MSKLPWEKLLEIANAERKECVKDALATGWQYYSFIKPDGYIVRLSGTCYGNVIEGGKNNSIFVHYTWPHYHQSIKNISRDIVLEYIKWWANDSFAAPAFINKDPEDIVDNGIMSDCNQSGALIIIGGMGARMVNTYPEIISNWHMFKEHIGPDAAIVAAHLLMPMGGHYIFSPLQTWFNTDSYKTAMKYIANRKITSTPLNPFRTHAKYYPLAQVFDCNSEGGMLNPFTSYPFPKSQEREVKNSFGKVVRVEKNCYFNESIGDVLKEFVKLHMEIQE